MSEADTAKSSQQYTIEFNQEEIDKLKEVATAMKAAAGQKPEWVALAEWLTGILDEDEDAEETPDKPKRKKRK